MKLLSAVVCAVLILVLHQKSGLALVIEPQAAKALCSNEEYVKPSEIKIGTKGPLATLNVKYSIVKKIPEDAICHTQYFSKEGEEYNKLIFELAPEKCCKILFENEMYMESMKDQNVPKKCPIEEGNYSLDNYVMNTTKWSDVLQTGEFRVQFRMTLPSEECLYGTETDWKISDPK